MASRPMPTPMAQNSTPQLDNRYDLPTFRCPEFQKWNLLFLHKRALALAQRLGRLFGWNAAENLIVVPCCLGFARCLDLNQIHVVHQAAVLAHSPFGEEIVNRQLPYLLRDG